MTATSSPSTNEEEEKELRLLNHCLSDAMRVHLFVSNSITTDASSSTLLSEECQSYLEALLLKYNASSALRKKLKSGKSLHYLGCLTDAATRADFIRIAACPSFATAAQ